MTNNTIPTTTAPAPIDIHIDGKQYRDKLILGPIHLRLAKGSFTAITGPSGIGKTTLLKMLAGLDSEIVQATAPLSKSVVFQEPRLLPWRTVRENLTLICHKKKGIDTLLKNMGLLDAADLFPGQISLGMARRVSLARAFAIEPELLLLDEPFVSLDEPTAERLRESLWRFWKQQGMTVLMVTHHLREALQLADSIVVLDGKPATIQQHYHYHTPHDERNDEWISRNLSTLEQKV